MLLNVKYCIKRNQPIYAALFLFSIISQEIIFFQTNVIMREIINAWYISCGFFFQLFEPQRWYVFGMKSGIPFLEYYDKEESAFSGEPLHSFCMANCKRITYTMGRLNKVWTFCIFLDDRILELTAESRYCFVCTELLMNLNFWMS